MDVSHSQDLVPAHDLGQFVKCERRWAYEKGSGFNDMDDRALSRVAAKVRSADPLQRAEGEAAKRFLETVRPAQAHGDAVHAADARRRLGRPAPRLNPIPLAVAMALILIVYLLFHH